MEIHIQISTFSYSASPMHSFKKSERLCSKILFEELIASEISFVKYPFRIIMKESSQPGEFAARIAISVSKKKFKRAVERNYIKRLGKEAFRQNKNELYQHINPGQTIDILFIYLDNTLPSYAKIEKAIKSALQKIPAIICK